MANKINIKKVESNSLAGAPAEGEKPLQIEGGIEK
jgi:hypothetical protein